MLNTVGAEHVFADTRAGVSASHCDVDVAAADSRRESAEGHLDCGPVVGVGHQPVGQRV
jgi:hypothetical protein